MSTCRFSYDSFQEGRSDALRETRILRNRGQWTKEKRARWTKEARSIRECLKHARPGMSQSISYYAGRIAALRSKQTAHFSAQEPHPEEKTVITVYGPLPLLLLTVTLKMRQLVQMHKEAIELGRVVLPSAFLLGFGISNVIWPASHIVESLRVVALVVLWSRPLLCLLSFFSQMAESDRRQEQ